MFRWTIPFGASLCCAATFAGAQTPVRPADPIFVRAQSLVSDGNGVAGRALIDSVIAKTPTTSQLYPQALFWRATLAANASDAESDYKHIVVDYPLAPQAEDALLRLAQLELARGDRDGALGHLQRIPRDYPRSKSLARANYWTARVLFEKNDVPNACVANANALSQADASEVELKNQIQYQGQRCPLAPVVAAVVPPTTGSPANLAVTAPTASPPSSPAVSAPSTTSTTPAAASATTSNATSSPPKPVTPTPTEKLPVTVDVVPPRAASTSASTSVATAERPKPPTEASVSKPSIVDPAKSPKPRASKAATSKGSGYSVQVAAYTHKAEADKLTATLNKRGYSARVDGSTAPFRVRLGRYATENEAEDALKKIKASHMDGFVVRAPER